MSIVVRFPVRRHARASSVSFDASRANKSAVKPAALARSVSKTRVHHSDGMLLRCHHLRILDDPPHATSSAMASREGQMSMTAQNDVGSESVMSQLLGHSVPICKPVMCRDSETPVGHSVSMRKEAENLSESAWKLAFQHRLARIQGKRTHEAMAEYLEMPVENWKKCVNRGDTFPIRKLPRLALLAGIPVESLIKGDRDDELPAAVEKYRKRTVQASKPATRRAS